MPPRPTRKTEQAAAKGELPICAFDSAGAWASWLAEHHGSSGGIWLKFAKKASKVPSPTYAEALQVALCWGWIDGQKRSFDEASWLQRFTPRGKKSIWSKINCGHVEALIAAGEMQPAGLAQVEAARADGRWDAAYASQKNSAIPEDLATVFAAEPAVGAFFASLPSSHRYAFLFRLQTAKRPETRQKRLAEYLALLRQGKRLRA